jgi:hypothetical protein
MGNPPAELVVPSSTGSHEKCSAGTLPCALRGGDGEDESLDSKAARDVLISIGDACYERLTRYPQAEIAAVNETASALKALVQSQEAFKRDTARIGREYATPIAAVQTLKLALERVRPQLGRRGQ